MCHRSSPCSWDRALLESAYEQCLAHELSLANIPFKRQVPAALKYKGLDVECGYRMDMLIDETIVLSSRVWTKSCRFMKPRS